MGRKSNSKDHPTDNNGLYQKRLRSWKPVSTELKSNHTINDEVTPIHRSSIYTYPINLNYNRQSMLSNTILSESLTTESAFYCPSISCTSIQTAGGINNNHVTTSNLEDTKRKKDSSSSESLQLTCYQNSTKRSRFNSPMSIDDDTIDINQFDSHGPLLSSLNNDSLRNNSNSMEAAVKMVQPIVDIIFNAFEDQLKNIQPSISPQIYSPMIAPYFPSVSPVRPIVLHVVNFNIQLTSKQPSINSLTTQNLIAEHDHLPVTSLIELKEKVTSYLLSNNFIADHQTNSDHDGRGRKLKRIIQLAVVGVSVLCGYFLL